jgi:AcrR family transcriptional regulator
VSNGTAAAAAASTTRQQRAQATADQLLVAARTVFEEKGYRATTVGAITEAASTAHGTFYLYFKNKEDAFAKVFATVVAELEKESTAPWSGDARTTLHDAVAGYFQVVQRHKGMWRCLMEGMYQSAPLEQLWLEQRRPFVDRLERALRHLSERGDARELDVRATAVALGSMTEWTAFTVAELGEPADVSVEAAVDAIVELWYHGVFAG